MNKVMASTTQHILGFHVCAAATLALALGSHSVTSLAAEDVKVVNKVKTKIVNSSSRPVPVEGQIEITNPVEVEGTVDVRIVSSPAAGPRPVQFALAASFQDGQDQAGPAPGSFPPREVLLPGNETLVIEYVSCRAAVNAGQNLDITFIVPVNRNGTSIARRPYTAPLRKTVTRNSLGTKRDTLASNEKVSICLGEGCDAIPGNITWEGRVEIEGNRDTTAGFARVDCVVSGIFLGS